MARLNLTRTRDGKLNVVGEVPEDHYFSAGWIAERLAAGEAEVTVALKFDTGTVVYRLAALEGEDGNPTPSAWHVVLDSPAAGTTKGKTKTESEAGL